MKQGTKLPVSLSTEENEKRTEDTNTIDIDSFYPAEDSNDDVLQPYDQMRLISHESLMDHGHINNTTLVEASMTSESLFDTPMEGYAQENSSAQSGQDDSSANIINTMGLHQNYATILTFIEGSLVQTTESERDVNNHPIDGNYENNNQLQNRQPSMQQFANSGGNQLDEKQYIAYEVICCTFLLKIIYEGNYGRTNLEENMNATLNVHEIESGMV